MLQKIRFARKLDINRIVNFSAGRRVSCPVCREWLERRKSGRAWCPGCERIFRSIDFIMERDFLSLEEAAELISKVKG